MERKRGLGEGGAGAVEAARRAWVADGNRREERVRSGRGLGFWDMLGIKGVGALAAKIV